MDKLQEITGALAQNQADIAAEKAEINAKLAGLTSTISTLEASVATLQAQIDAGTQVSAAQLDGILAGVQGVGTGIRDIFTADPGPVAEPASTVPGEV